MGIAKNIDHPECCRACRFQCMMINHPVPTYEQKIAELVEIMEKTWTRVESPNTASYIATFRDMAVDILSKKRLS